MLSFVSSSYSYVILCFLLLSLFLMYFFVFLNLSLSFFVILCFFLLFLCYSLFFPSITFSYVILCFNHSITFSFCVSSCYSLFLPSITFSYVILCFIILSIFRMLFFFLIILSLFLSVFPHVILCFFLLSLFVKSYLDKLRVWQKKAIRLINNSYYRHPSSPLFLRLKMLPLSGLVSFNCILFMFNLKTMPHECTLKDLFRQNSQIHNYNTRQRCLIRQPFARTNVTLTSFHISCIKEWNSLPDGIKNSTTLSRFRSLSKTYLLERLT